MQMIDYSTPVKIMITGATGQLGSAVAEYSSNDQCFEVFPLGIKQLDITSIDQVREQLDRVMPDYVINCAGFNGVDAALHEEELCYRINAEGVKSLATACGDLSIPMLQVSSDFVFDGHYGSGYTEDDEVTPLGIYGQCKWQGEEYLRQLLPRHIILRVSWLFSGQGNNFLTRTLESARKEKTLQAVIDRRGCPTSTMDVARVICAMIKQLHNGADAWGTYHYCGAEVTNRYDFCKEILIAAGQYESFEVEKLMPISGQDYVTEAERPNSSVLVCKKLLSVFGIRQRSWRQELQWLMRAIYKTNQQDSK